MSIDRQELHADLIGLAVADPQAVAEVVLDLLRERPELSSLARRLVLRRLPTRVSHTDCGLRKASASDIAEIRCRLPVSVAQAEVRHRAACACAGVVADLSCRAGDEAVTVGGNQVSVVAMAAMLSAIGGDRTQAFSRLCIAIAEQLGDGSRHGVKPVTERARASRQDDDEPAVACIHALQACWPPAVGIPRLRHEGTLRFLGRLLERLRSAAAEDGDAASALASLAREFPLWSVRPDPRESVRTAVATTDERATTRADSGPLHRHSSRSVSRDQ